MRCTHASVFTQVAIFAVAGPLDAPFTLPSPGLDVDRDAPPSFLAKCWFELDAIPFHVPCRDTQFSLEGEAVKAIETALGHLHPTASAIIKARAHPTTRRVLGESNYRTQPVFAPY
jgi:alpha,alpha-trehalose phosphorylase (configuration-retaining)